MPLVSKAFSCSYIGPEMLMIENQHLDIRTVVKSDLQCSVVELIYGTTLRLPGEVIQKDTPHTVTDPAEMSCITSRHPQFAHCLSGMSTSAQALHHVRTFLFATMESTNL